MAVAGQHRIIEWIIGLERDGDPRGALHSGSMLLPAATEDGLLDHDNNDWDRFATIIARLGQAEAITFDYEGYGCAAFTPSVANSARLQQCTNFSSLAGGHQMITPPPTVAISNSRIGQFAMGDINNTTLITILDEIEQRIEELPADETDRAAARAWVANAKKGAAAMTTGAGGALLAQAMASLFGLR
jgi:hypothetical protein